MEQSADQNIQAFLDYLKFQKRYSRHTVISYHTDLESFFAFLKKLYDAPALPDIKAGMVRSWLASLKAEQNSSRTINRKISSLKTFFKYQLRQGLITVSPMTTVVSPKQNKRLPEFVDKRDTEVLFTQMEFPNDWTGLTDQLILQLFYSTGMRQAELISLKETQVDFAKDSIKVLGKGGKERIIPVSRELMNNIRLYIEQKSKQIADANKVHLLVRSNGQPLYPKYVYNSVKKYLSQVTTIEKRSPHILRHTFATHLTNNGADLNAVKELLGHSSLAATQVYTHNTIEKLKNIHRKAHPKA